VPEEVKYKLPWSENTYKDPDHHLNTSQTRLLSNSLEAFVKDAARPDNWRNSEGYIANWRADEKGTEEAPDACSDPT
jgi:hypothetical protein